MARFMFVICSVMLFLIGCQNDENASTYKNNEDRNGQRFVSNRDNRASDREGEDGYYILDQNPNFINTGERHNNYGQDIDKAKSMINDMKGYRSGPVWINGDNMWVTAYKKGMLSNNERRKEEAKLHRQLTGALPRYDIEVRIREDRS